MELPTILPKLRNQLISVIFADCANQTEKNYLRKMPLKKKKKKRKSDYLQLKSASPAKRRAFPVII